MAAREIAGKSQQQAAPEQTSGQALELARRGPMVLLGRYREEFASIAPKHVDAGAFVALAAAYIRRSPELSEAMIANTPSLMLALRECAALGHMVRKGEFSLTAFKSKKEGSGGWDIVGIEEWRGVVQRMFRSGGVRAVHVAVGRERDPVLGFQKGRDELPRHVYDEFASTVERGPLKAVWAWADLLHGGVSEVAWLNQHDVARHRDMSKSTRSQYGPPGGNFWGPPWPDEGPNTEAMWKKTALHVLEGLVPTSSGYLWEVAQAGAAVARTGAQGTFPGGDVDPAQHTDWVDGDVIPARTVAEGDRIRVTSEQGGPQ